MTLANVHLEMLWTGSRWAEGPAYFAAGRYLVWSDIPNNRMMRYDETDGSVSVFRQPSRNANGNTVDREGRLVSCEHQSRCVTRTEHDGSRTVLVERYQGKRLNSPNDVVVKSDGSIWFSDPTYGIDSDYEGDASPSEIGAAELHEPSLHRFESFDGESIPVFLFEPEGEGPFPVVVTVHGGPEAQWLPWFSSSFAPFTQYLVSRGYAVAAPNVRGSTGYGGEPRSPSACRARWTSPPWW